MKSFYFFKFILVIFLSFLSSACCKDEIYEVALMDSSVTPPLLISIYKIQEKLKMKEPYIEKEGYKFHGWYLDHPKYKVPFDFNSRIVLNLKLYTKWELLNYIVTFDLNGGQSEKLEPQKVQIEGKVTLPKSDPTREHYSFDGWYTEISDRGGIRFDFTKTIGAQILKKNNLNMPLYAWWNIDKHQVTFDLDGGNGINPDFKTVEYGGNVLKPNDPKRNNYDFKHWVKQNETNAFNFDSPIESNTKLKSLWERRQHTVTFNFKKKDVTTEETTQIVNEGDKVNKPSNEKENIDILGWYKKHDFSDSVFNFENETIASNLTLYAKWQHKPKDKDALKTLLDDTSVDLNKIDISSITEMDDLLKNKANFDRDISKWKVGHVTSMKNMFYGAKKFNKNISGWDVSNVTNAEGMFYDAEEFNQPLNNWKTSKITNAKNMFRGAKKFNQPLNDWNTSNFKNMHGIFYKAESFNQKIDKWDTSNVTEMNFAFYRAKKFNQPLNSWNTSKVTNMKGTFQLATEFNQDINNWNVENVQKMDSMFYQARVFNKSLNNWKTTSVEDMKSIFYGASAFNGELKNWDVNNVTNMESMFNGAGSFDKDISTWKVDKVTTMEKMFKKAKKFNQNIGSWNIQAVKKMDKMFEEALVFCQDLSKWNCRGKSTKDMFKRCKMCNKTASCPGKTNCLPKNFKCN